ncbi:MAG: galactokinase [Clostridia bacterium]|nr:galactokinase [Clostridia bacterium]
MTSEKIIQAISDGALDERFAVLYPDAPADAFLRARYINAIAAFAELYGGEGDISLFSVPGRSELSGNHTDHNHGCVIAASIDLDIIAVARPREDGVIRLKSEGFPEDIVSISDFSAPDPTRFGRSDALIAGVCIGFDNAGYRVGGFDAYTTSNVLKGSGLSSSAAFEDMIGNILNHMYNNGNVSYIEISKISQFAENKFFGKPCGLMDQVACAAGGIVAIDFEDPDSPVVEKVDFDITAAGYCLCIVDTGGNHADLTADYAAVPAEMKAVSAHFGKSCLREVNEDEFISSIPALRTECGDRAILRALHFFEENRRVAYQREKLASGDLVSYLNTVTASGRSSFCYLQNVYTTANVAEQGLSLALCLAEKYLSNVPRASAYRVHGGGFAGTIQAYVPTDYVGGFKALMDATFGDDACAVLHIRPEGAIKLI